MKTRAELQAALKQLRIDGYDIQIKLTAKTERLLAEYNRLTSESTQQTEAITSESPEVYSVKQPLKTIEDAQGENLETQAETLDPVQENLNSTSKRLESPLGCTSNSTSERLEGSLSKTLSTLPEDLAIAVGDKVSTTPKLSLGGTTTKQLPKNLEALPDKVLQLQLGSYPKKATKDLLIASRSAISGTQSFNLKGTKQPSKQPEGLPDKDLEQELSLTQDAALSRTPRVTSPPRSGVFTLEQVCLADLFPLDDVTKQPLKQLESLLVKDLNLQLTLTQDAGVRLVRTPKVKPPIQVFTLDPISQTDSYPITKQPIEKVVFNDLKDVKDINLHKLPSKTLETLRHRGLPICDLDTTTDISVYVPDDYDAAKQHSKRLEGLPDKHLDHQPGEMIEQTTSDLRFYSTVSPEADISRSLCSNYDPTKQTLEQPEGLSDIDLASQPGESTKRAYWIDGTELGAVLGSTSVQALRNLEDGISWLKRAGSSLKAFAEGFRGGWKEAEGRRHSARLLRCKKSLCTNSRLTVPKECLSKAIPLANPKPPHQVFSLSVYGVFPLFLG